MRRLIYSILAVLLFLTDNIINAQYQNNWPALNRSYQENYFSIDFFYENLSPYGEWIEIENDLIVWRPTHIPFNWKPYTNGRWLWTNEGWFWDSNEPFGWAVYHYGRWHFDEYYGWLWLPDTQWAPAWVEWRYSDNFIGWAPLSPYASFDINFGIRFSVRTRMVYKKWCFVRINKFYGTNINRYLIKRPNYKQLFRVTKYRTNFYFRNNKIISGGIDRNFIERRISRRIKTNILLKENKRNTIRNNRFRKFGNNRIRIYKPTNDMFNKHSKKNYVFRKGNVKTRIKNKYLTLRKPLIKRNSAQEINGNTNQNKIKRKELHKRNTKTEKKLYKLRKKYSTSNKMKNEYNNRIHRK